MRCRLSLLLAIGVNSEGYREILGICEDRILREIRRRTHVVGAFPDGQSALRPGYVTSLAAVGDELNLDQRRCFANERLTV